MILPMIHIFAWMDFVMIKVDDGIYSSPGGKPDIDLVCVHRFFSTTVLYHPERRRSTVAASLSASGRSSEKLTDGQNRSIAKPWSSRGSFRHKFFSGFAHRSVFQESFTDHGVETQLRRQTRALFDAKNTGKCIQDSFFEGFLTLVTWH
jgi:hypothetical protein